MSMKEELKMDAAAYIQRGKEATSKREAIRNYRKTIKIEPNNYEAHYLWGKLVSHGWCDETWMGTGF